MDGTLKTVPVRTNSRRKRDRYSKISLKAKLIFYRKVIHQGKELR